MRRGEDGAPSAVLEDVRRDGKDVGEIIMRGNLVMKGYYRDATATAEATRGGWFHTGDLAVRHPGGEVQILDRGKDIIISGGENISSVMVEQELASHPWVAETAVIARPHPKWSEAAHAFVLLSRQGQDALRGLGADEAEEKLSATLQEHCRKYMSGFAVPKWFAVVDELPKTSTGSTSRDSLTQKSRSARSASASRSSSAIAASTTRPSFDLRHQCEMAGVDEVLEVPTCRICRSEEEPGYPLYHPCKCSGSIQYCHQDWYVARLTQPRAMAPAQPEEVLRAVQLLVRVPQALYPFYA